MFGDNEKAQLKNIIKDIDLKKADIMFAWRLAHDPLIRSFLTNMPFESVLGIDEVSKKEKHEKEAQVFRSSMLLALLFVGREDEVGETIPPPVGMSVDEFMRSCIKGHKGKRCV